MMTCSTPTTWPYLEELKFTSNEPLLSLCFHVREVKFETLIFTKMRADPLATELNLTQIRCKSNGLHNGTSHYKATESISTKTIIRFAKVQ